MTNYIEIKSKHPEMIECFFAFSDQHLSKGIKEKIPEGKEIFSGGMGLYGTREGIKKFLAFYDAITVEIGEKCDPQEVYDYEYNNHECSYTCDDTEAIKIVVSYFGEEKSTKVKRRHAIIEIENLNFKT